MPVTPNSIVALDVGAKRVGVAIASEVARLPRPLTTLIRGDDFFERLNELLRNEGVVSIIVGLPRGLDGQETQQTEATRDFIKDLRLHLSLRVETQDEALTSKKAEAELETRGRSYERGDVDALAATYILQDYLDEHPVSEVVQS